MWGGGRLGITMASQKNSRKKESNNEHLYLKKYLFSLEHNYTVSTKNIRIVTHTHTLKFSLIHEYILF